MTARTITIESRNAEPRSMLTQAIVAAWRAYRKHREARRSIQLLRSMDDHMLRDIGISRGEIRYVVRTGGKVR